MSNACRDGFVLTGDWTTESVVQAKLCLPYTAVVVGSSPAAGTRRRRAAGTHRPAPACRYGPESEGSSLALCSEMRRRCLASCDTAVRDNPCAVSRSVE